VVNVLHNEIRLFWSCLSTEYVEHVAKVGRPLKEMRTMLYHSRSYSMFSTSGIKSFIDEFMRAHRRMTA
jgi:hypothetical protein